MCDALPKVQSHLIVQVEYLEQYLLHVPEIGTQTSNVILTRSTILTKCLASVSQTFLVIKYFSWSKLAQHGPRVC